MNPAHYTFTRIFMWNNANYTEKCYKNKHTLCISNCQLQLKPVFLSFYYNHATHIQHPLLLSGTVPRKDLLNIHYVKMPTVS